MKKRRSFLGVVLTMALVMLLTGSAMATEGEVQNASMEESEDISDVNDSNQQELDEEITSESGEGDADIDAPEDADAVVSDDGQETVFDADEDVQSDGEVIQDEELVTFAETAEEDDTLSEEENEIATLAVQNVFQKGADGSWYYYVDGKISTGTNSVIYGTVNGETGWWYVVGGKVQTSFTGLADYPNENGWWYIENGKVTFTKETVAQNKNGWYYVKDSKVQFSYNGFAKNGGGWWYIENGKVTFNKNSVIQDTDNKIDGTSSWWYVVGSKVQTDFTGLADYSNANGWWYIENGKVTFTKETVAQNKNGWYYVKDSKVQFSYNGFAKNGGGWWYIENGKVTFNKNSVIQDTNNKIDGKSSWWYVVGSKVQTDFTGLADYSNANGWWYIENGKVTFTKETVAQNKNGWYYVKDSKVQFSYNGFAKNGGGWWYIENGKVTFNKNSVIQDTNKLIDGTSGWWYVVGSKVQTDFTGLADYSNENGWWYIKDGKVDFSFEGIGSNKNGKYYIKDGKVDFNYTGQYEYDGETYYVTKGKANRDLPLGMSEKMYETAQEQSSSTKWLIVIDTNTCRLGVFTGTKGEWTPEKYWQCAPGKDTSWTPRGTFALNKKGLSFSGSSYTCWYYSQFRTGYMIHSVLYNLNSQTSVKDGRVGMRLSNGCVRLELTNAKWVYDNVPLQTRVYIY